MAAKGAGRATRAATGLIPRLLFGQQPHGLPELAGGARVLQRELAQGVLRAVACENTTNFDELRAPFLPPCASDCS